AGARRGAGRDARRRGARGPARAHHQPALFRMEHGPGVVGRPVGDGSRPRGRGCDAGRGRPRAAYPPDGARRRAAGGVMAVLDRLSMPLACLITTAVLAGGCGTRPGSGDEGAEDAGARGAIAEGTPTGIRYLRGEEGDRFARATAPREFRFPEDHGAHPEFRAEWWYFTGNVFSAEGRHYGFELTFFR